MSFQIPNAGDVPGSLPYAVMAYRYASDEAIIEAAHEGYMVYTGCQLVRGTTTGTVKVNSGTGVWNGLQLDVAAQDNVPCIASVDPTNPLWILYELDNTGTLRANVGTPAIHPVPNAPTPTRIVVGAVLVPAAAPDVDSSLSAANTNAKIVDKRVMRTTADVRYYAPIATVLGISAGTATDGTSSAQANSTWQSGAINLNTLTGTQTVTVSSTTGYIGDATHGGAIVVTHGTTDYLITYGQVASSTTITNCTAVGAPSVTMTNGDVVSRQKIVTSATANFNVNHIGSVIMTWFAPPGVLPVGNSTPVILGAGALPNNTGTFAQLSVAPTGATSGGAWLFNQVRFTWTKMPGTRFVIVDNIGPGGGGGGGATAGASTAKNGGGGGGGGGRKRVTLFASDLGATETVQLLNGGRGGTGGGTGGGNGNAAAQIPPGPNGGWFSAQLGSQISVQGLGAHCTINQNNSFFVANGGTNTGTGGGGGINCADSEQPGSTINLSLTGGNASTTATPTAPSTVAGLPGPGAGGGGEDAANNRRDGQAGALGNPAGTGTAGTAGTGSGANGGNAATDSHKWALGSGGGSGAASNSNATNGGNGGNGSSPGGGGGGGGSSRSGGTAVGGTGGVGGDGAIAVYSYG